MRVAGEAIARQAGIENGDLAAGTAELQGGGEAGKAAADDHPIVLGRAAPADESDPPARPERASHMGERPCRIVEEHHPETREQDVVLYFPFSETTPYVRRRCLKLGPNCDPESIYAWTQSAG